MRIVNTTDNVAVNISNILHGIPDWSVIGSGWTSAWVFMIYFYICFYATVFVYCMLLYLKYYKRLVRERLQLLLLLFIASNCLILCIFYIADPCGYYNRIPKLLMRLLWKIPNIFLIGSYCLVQMIIMKLTRLYIPSLHCNGIRFFMFMTTFYFMEMVTVETVMYIYPDFRELAFMNESLFIVFTLYLSLCFIYGAPTISKYTKQAEKAKKELSIHSLSKLDSAMPNESLRNKPRIKHPRIRTTVSGNRISLLSEDESSCSDLNNESPISKRRSIKEIENGRFDYERRLKPVPSKRSRSKRKQNNGSDMKENFTTSRESSDTSQGDEGIGRGNIEMTIQHTNLLHHSLSHDAISIATKRNNFFKDSLNSHQQIRRSSDPKHSEPMSLMLHPSVLMNDEMKVFESGYIADSERLSVQSEETDTKFCNELKRRFSKGSSTEIHLPTSSSFLCFQRLRQGRMLKFFIRFAYSVTVLVMLTGVGGIYHIYSDYSAIILHKEFQFMPWLTFQYCQRSVEAMTALLLTMSVHTLLSFRSQRSGKRRVRKVRDSSASNTTDRDTRLN